MAAVVADLTVESSEAVEDLTAESDCGGIFNGGGGL